MLTVEKIMNTTWDEKDSELIDELLGVLTELNVDTDTLIEYFWLTCKPNRLHEMRLPNTWVENLGKAVTNYTADLIRTNIAEYIEYAMYQLDIPYTDDLVYNRMKDDLVGTLDLVTVFQNNPAQYEGTPTTREVYFNNELDYYPLNQIDMLTPRALVLRWLKELNYDGLSAN